MKKAIVAVSFFFLFHVGTLAVTSYASQGVQVYPQAGMKEKDRITALPGQPGKASFEQYSGLITINHVAGRALFYYFVEADSPDKDSLPLVLWLNGGPGCSSISGGAFSEIGPFRVASDGKTLLANEFSWNKAANVLFLDQPVFVGYSYSNTTSDMDELDDQIAAADSYTFLLNWFERFPEYKQRDFFMTGESFAGHYVPQISKVILENNKLGLNVHINLKGIALGNPQLDFEIIGKAQFDYLYHHSLISLEMYEDVMSNCNFKVTRPNTVLGCTRPYVKAKAELRKGAQYNIYEEPCDSGLTAEPKYTSAKIYDSCMRKYVEAYLGRKDVQAAFHVTNFNSTYIFCQALPGYQNRMAFTVLPDLKTISENSIPIWIYGGDLDTSCPVTGLLKSIQALNVTEAEPWRPWYLNNNSGSKVAGYSVVYKEGVTYATVRNAGHLVPAYKPEEALVVFKSFLKGAPLPYNASPLPPSPFPN